jgi:tetratricopeptide (TPR) repeat protein
MPKSAFRPGVVPLILLLAFWMPGTTAFANTPATPERPAEYMVYQYPDTAFVIRVDLPQAEFGVRVLDPDDALLRSANVAGRRLGPIFLYIGPPDQPRQLMIEVEPGRAVDRSRIGLELMQFGTGDRNSAVLLGAYRMFSVGVETAHSEDTGTWASKVYSLRDAARQFARMGREELRLWAEYFAAQLVLYRLDDAMLALEWAGEARAAAERAGLDSLVLAARVLESEAWLARLDAAAEPAASDLEGAHEALSTAAWLAGSLGYASEQARALYRDGLVWERQGDDETALERYRAALDLLPGAQDEELLNEVRMTAAAAYERLGSTSGALAMLDSSDRERADSPGQEPVPDQAGRLYDRGRLLNLAYRYPEAAEALDEALTLQRQSRDAGAWGRTGLELAWSLYSVGRSGEALELLREALARTPVQGNEPALIRGWGSLADMLGEEGRYAEAARARDSQRELIRAAEARGAASAAYASAVDALRQFGAESSVYRERLAVARRVAASEQDGLTEARATAALCLAESGPDRVSACSAAARQSLERLRNSGIPRLAVEAAVSSARLAGRMGRSGEAARYMQRALDEAQWYRQALPGVLGVWYPTHIEALTVGFLDLVAPPGASAERSLLALERLRHFERATLRDDLPSPLDPDREESLRSLLARRDTAPDGDRLEAEVNRALAAARRNCTACETGAGLLDEAGLDARLQALDSDQSVLAYALGGEEAWAVIASDGMRRRVELGPAGPIRDRLRAVHSALAGNGPSGAASELEEAGRSLLSPLQGSLTRNVYLLSSGSLRSVPLDTFRLDGRYLAERARVVNLGSLGSLERIRPHLNADYENRVFLAGNPQSQRDPFRFELSASPEITAVTGRFVGPGLHVVQGVALGRDEFSDPRFSGAALLHLALPGVIDLARPERSRLLLGGTDEAGVGRRGLAPSELRLLGGAADLVVLSGTAVSPGGEPLSGYLPLVSDLAVAGAGTVVFTLWPPGEESAAAFARAFYERLAADRDIESAFFETRSAGFPGTPPAEFENWSGFQLLIR